LLRPHWLADDTVRREPVSAPNSLLTGKNTGKFAKPRPSRHPISRSTASFAEFPYGIEQGILGEKTGKLLPRTGKFIRSQEAPLLRANRDCEHVLPANSMGPLLIQQD